MAACFFVWCSGAHAVQCTADEWARLHGGCEDAACGARAEISAVFANKAQRTAQCGKFLDDFLLK